MEHRKRKSYVVYALCDDTGIRYIGCTTRPRNRLRTHLSDNKIAASSAVKEWLREIRERHVAVRFVIIERGRGHRWQRDRREKFWIAVYSVAIGTQLLNFFHRSDFLDARIFERREKSRLRKWKHHKWYEEVYKQTPEYQKREARRLRRLSTPPMPLLNGRPATSADWARHLGISRQAMHLRLKRMSPEQAASAPVTGPHRKAVAQ